MRTRVLLRAVAWAVVGVLLGLAPAGWVSLPVAPRVQAAYALDSRAVAAINYALSKQGSHSWDYWCLKFCNESYIYGAGVWPTGYETAKIAANSLGASSRIGSSAPRGSYVFYDWWGTVGGVYSNYGHVGISLGDGTMISAWAGSGVCIKPITGNGLTYIGWAPPPINPPITDWSTGSIPPPRYNPIAPGDAGFTKGGTASYWWSSGLGVYGSGLYTYCNGGVRDCWGRWTFDLSKLNGTANYKVEAFVPRNHATTGNAHYHINTASGVAGKSVNQNALYDAWADLGTYALNQGSAWVELDDATGETYSSSSSPKIGFDAVRLTYVSAIAPPADTTAPSTSISGVPSAWSNSNATLSLSASDASGVKAVYYRLNGGTQQTYSSAFTVSSEGVTTVNYWAVDNANNVETARSATVRIDKSAPVTSDDHVASYASSATIHLTASDTNSGVAHTYHTVNGLPQTEGTVISIGGRNTYTVRYWSVDVAGNVEAAKTITFAIGLPKASVSTPVAPSTMYRSHAYTIYGYVVPKHSSGTYLVTLRLYKKNSSGTYVYHHSVRAKRYYYSSTKTKYKAYTSLPHSGRWRVRAVHECASHTTSYSGYDYITVR